MLAHLQSHLQCILLSGRSNDLRHCQSMAWQHLHVEGLPQLQCGRSGFESWDCTGLVQDVKILPSVPIDQHFVDTTHTLQFLVVTPETLVSPFAKPMHRPRVAERVDEFECILCLKLLYQPVTTPCGHTFCRDCFLRAGDHSNKCPMCRTVSSYFTLNWCCD